MKKISTLFLFMLVFSTGSIAQPGSNDASFNTGTGFNNYVFSTSIQSDDKIITGGNFTTLNSISRNRIARLNADGSPDGTFDPGSGFNNLVLPTSIQTDGKIIVGGNFTSYNGTSITRIARLNPDGSIDATFNPGTGFNAIVYSITIQADGKILVGGDFSDFNGTAINRIARLNPDGSLDGTFSPGTGFDNTVWSIRVQGDGKIIAGGSYNNYNGISKNYISRLNSNGSLDATFNPGTGFNGPVYSVNIQANGKIIALGQFDTFNSNTTNRIALLNSDGSLDATFNSGTGFNNITWSSNVEADGKIIIGGQFTSFNGNTRNGIVRLNADGSLDPSFNPGTGFNNIAYTTNIQSNGKIIVGGSFTSFNGTPRNRIARLLSCVPITADAPSNVTVCDNYTLPSLIVGNYYTAPSGGGTLLNSGDIITSTQTLYVYATNGSCTDENSFVITINFSPTTDAPSNVSECDSYPLPNLTVGNYYTAPNGGGTSLNAGDIITSSQTLYVYATNGSCSSENSFDVTINTTPTADAPINVSECDSYSLPILTVGNYYTAPNGGGTFLNAGDIITSNQTLYVYATNLSCSDENSFEITINNTPTVDGPNNVSECDSYTLPILNVGNYFTAINGGGTMLNQGDIITNTQSLYIYASNGSCSNENSFDVTINNSPINTVTVTDNTITADEIGATYQWLDCDNGNNPINGETNQNYTPLINGNYAVEITKNGCSSISDCQSITILGGNEQKQFNFSVYPNPTSGKLFINLNDFKDSETTINVRNSIGQLLISENYKSIDILELTIDGENGLYLIEIITGNKSTVLKIIKN